MNNDGNVDVVSVNSQTNRFALLRGDGKGHLGDPEFYSTGGHPLAIDLAVSMATATWTWSPAISSPPIGRFTKTTAAENSSILEPCRLSAPGRVRSYTIATGMAIST
jgi:hypothetical protein